MLKNNGKNLIYSKFEEKKNNNAIDSKITKNIRNKFKKNLL